MRVMLYLDVMTKKKRGGKIGKYRGDIVEKLKFTNMTAAMAVASLVVTVIAIFVFLMPYNCSGWECLGAEVVRAFFLLVFIGIGLILAVLAMVCAENKKIIPERKKFISILSLVALLVSIVGFIFIFNS